MSYLLVTGGTTIKHTPAAGGGSVVPAPTNDAASDKLRINPSWTAGPTGKSPYRPLVHAVLENLLFCANGWDRPFFWDGGSNWFDMGSVAPSTGGATEDTGGSAIPTGTTVDYYLTWRDTTRNRQTAPQSIQVITTSSANVDLTWTDPVLGEFDQAWIFRRLQATGAYVKLAAIAIATGAYTDSTTEENLGAIPYIDRARETKPPIFAGIASHLNRIFGWTGEDSNLYYSSQSRSDGEFVVDDFPSGNVLQVDPHDGDVIVAVVVLYGEMYVLKRRGVYVVSGTNPESWSSRGVFSDRGCLSPHAVASAEGLTFLLDENGLYATDLRGEPSVAGASELSQESPLLPTWKRLNRDALHLARVFYEEEERLLHVFVALDHDPTPSLAGVFDIGRQVWVSEDDGVPAFAAGRIESAVGTSHDVIVDELLNLWEIGIGASEGVTGGTIEAPVTGVGSKHALTSSAATYDVGIDGPIGAPLDRSSAAGAMVDENRVASVTADTLEPLYFSESAPATGEVVSVGVVRSVVRALTANFGTSDDKFVRRIIVEADEEASGRLLVEALRDAGAWITKTTIDLSEKDGRHIVPILDRCYFWTLQLSQRQAGERFAIHAVDVYVRPREDRQ